MGVVKLLMDYLASKLTVCYIVLFIYSSISYGIVDMRNANYSGTWVDLDLGEAGYNLKISRTYNSRALFNGVFGFGWCSDIETKLNITPDGNLKLTECGAGQEIYYLPREINSQDITKTVAQIIDNLKSQKKMNEATLNFLQADLQTNHSLRTKYAFDLKVAIPLREGSRFFVNGKEVENVIYTKGYYTRCLVDGSFQRFSKEGRLTHVYDKKGNYIKIDYEKDLIKELLDNNGRRLTFKFYSNRKVKSIAGPNNLLVEYKFHNLDDLSYVKNGWKNVYTYQYDNMHNLLRANYPDGTSISLIYDKKRNWVTSFIDRDRCREDYVYEDSLDDPKNHYWSVVKKICEKQVVANSKYEFWHKTRSDGERYLWRVDSMVNGVLTEVTYHELFGKPIAIKKSGLLTSFDYYPNGQVKQKAAKKLVISYEYSKESYKVISVTTISKNDKGAFLKTLKSNFIYDSKGDLTVASNSDGQRVEMIYDTKGRIVSIMDQAKKHVKIEYDERSGKPAMMTYPGLGTIQLVYKASGEIDRFSSKKGGAVATQVASTFNKLYEVLSPAVAEVYN